jgi:DNA helicase HerA-like ATPase
MEPITYQAAPCVFWDIYGKRGHPIRATVSEMGPQLLSRLLGCNDTQEGVITIAFQYADDNDLLLLDFKDLRSLLAHISTIAPDIQRTYGNVAPASIGAVQRQLLLLERDGAPQFFGEPALELADFMRVDAQGRGYVNVLDATTLINSPRLYSTFLLWLLAELFEQLPEVGDPDKPKLVFFFDEAHLLFDGAPKALVDKIEQVVRLIRSKGVGVYFVTQNPADVPDKVLGQLGNRVQHALRAFSARDQKAVKAAAETMRDNDKLDEEKTITELGVGEALVSFLDEKGRPGIVERAFIVPPGGQIGPIETGQRQQLMQTSLVAGVYEKTVDRESAYEVLKARAAQAQAEQAQAQAQVQAEVAARKAEAEAPAGGGGLGGIFGDLLGGATGAGGRRREGVVEALAKSAARSVGSQVGRAIIRGVLGSILGGKR